MPDQDNTQPESSPASNREDATRIIRSRIEELHKSTQGAHTPQNTTETLMEQFHKKYGSHPDKEKAWHEFYASLNDFDKNRIWQEHHEAQQKVSLDEVQKPENDQKPIEETAPAPSPEKTYAQSKAEILEKTKRFEKFQKSNRIKPIIIAVTIGILFLFMNYNELVIAQVKQYITPASTQNSPVIIDPNAEIKIGNEPKIIIPKINVDVPVVYDVKTFDDSEIQKALERGVVHYGTTPVPGEAGNNVIVGHSSNNFFNSGKYKFAFVLLDRLNIDDTFILHHEGTRYIYKVTNKQVVAPDDFSLLQPTEKPTTTLITCDPPGTSWRRLIVQGEQISPEPTEKQNVKPEAPEAEESPEIVPGNSPSLFQRFRDWIF